MGVYDPRGGGNVHIDKVLTNISLGYPNAGFVGDNLFPVVKVKKQSDKYYVFGREAWVLEPGSDIRTPGAEANEIPGIAVSLAPYFAIEHALQIAVTDEERENADSPLSPDRDGTELVTQKILLGREVAIHDLVTATANYAPGKSTTLVGTAQWNEATMVSKPVKDVRIGRMAVHAGLFVEPNTMILPYQVIAAFEEHPDFIDRIKYSERAIVTPELIAVLFHMDKVIVPEVGYNTARMGATEALAYLWGKDVVMAYVPPRPGMKIPAFGYEFAWTYPGGQVMVTDRWREEKRGSDVIRVRRRYDLQGVAVDSSNRFMAGYLIKNAVS
jgi:hypothetical protein